MDFKELAENLGLEEDEYLEIIELFIETGISDLDKLRTAIEEGDAGKAAEAVHSMKGAAGNLGLGKIQEAARRIEEEARNEALSDITESLQDLKNKFDQLRQSAKK